MNKWQVKLSENGFLKLNYYIEEQVAQEYINPPTERSSVDVWIYDILAKISKETELLENQDLRALCLTLYPNFTNSPSSTFEKAIGYINQNNLVEWLSI